MLLTIPRPTTYYLPRQLHQPFPPASVAQHTFFGALFLAARPNCCLHPCATARQAKHSSTSCPPLRPPCALSAESCPFRFEKLCWSSRSTSADVASFPAKRSAATKTRIMRLLHLFTKSRWPGVIGQYVFDHWLTGLLAKYYWWTCVWNLMV